MLSRSAEGTKLVFDETGGVPRVQERRRWQAGLDTYSAQFEPDEQPPLVWASSTGLGDILGRLRAQSVRVSMGICEYILMIDNEYID